MKSKYKLTSFARFILFMLIFLPASYLGAGLYKGEITPQQIIDKCTYTFTVKTDDKMPETEYNCSEILELKEKEISLLKERIEILETSRQ